MSKGRLASLVLIALLGCAIWAFSPPAKAEIEQSFKAQLIAEANAIAADVEDFRQLVRTEVSGEIIKAKGKGTEALALLKRSNGVQTSIVNAALAAAKGFIEQAQTGVNDARGFKEFSLVNEVQSLSAIVDWGQVQTPSLVTETEAQELKEIINNCLGGCLTSVNLTLVDISKYLAAATKDFEGVQAYLRVVPSPTRSNLLRAKSLVTSGLRKLESAWKGEMRIKDSMKCLIYGLYKFKSTVLLAPLKTSGLALSLPGVAAGALSGPSFQVSGGGRGPIRFAALGSGVAALRVQVFSLAGRAVFDSGFLSSYALEWLPVNDRGAPLATGVYLYVIGARLADGTLIRSEVRKLVVLR